MEHYVGLDVSLKLTAICIVDRTGTIQREGVVHPDPEAIAALSNQPRRMSRGSDSKREQR
jgi:transposase